MSEKDASGGGTADDSTSDPRRWMRELGALLALPAMWVDHEPREIASGLLSVLFGVLDLDGAYARFEGASAGPPLEVWRPHGPDVPAALRAGRDAAAPRLAGISVTEVDGPGARALRIVSLPLDLPWERALVVVSAARRDFPDAMETHLLRIAVGQAAIAIHTANRLARERTARSAAEAAVVRQSALLRSLADDVEPAIAAAAHRLAELSRSSAQVDVPAVESAERPGLHPASEERMSSVPQGLPLTRREAEVLGLLAQGLSNKEIAGLMWLSDRTVERHVTSLYRKIGVARRSEATAYALRHGVV